MTNALWHRLDRAARHVAPFVITVMLVVLNAIPLPVPDYRSIVPLIPLMAIYYWALYRPDLMPIGAVFLVGILEDVLTGAPLGLNTLLFLLVHSLIRSRRRMIAGKGFAVVWIVFMLVVLGAGIVSWLVASLLYDAPIRLEPVATQLMLTLVLYPCLAWLLIRVQRAFLANA